MAPKATQNVKFHIDKKEFDRYFKALGRQFHTLVDDAMVDAGTIVFVPALQAALERNNSVFTETLKSKLSVRKSRGRSVNVGAFETSYGQLVDEGSPPAIITSRERGKIARWLQKKEGLPPKQARQAAFAISRSIAKKGREPHPFIEQAVEENLSLFDATLANELGKRLKVV